MALSGKYISIDRIIEGVFRDSGFPPDEINWQDCMEWAGECIDLIGVNLQYINKVTDGQTDLGHPEPIVIDDYRGALPCDMYGAPIQIREYCNKIPLRHATSNFHFAKICPPKTTTTTQENITNLYGQYTFTNPLKTTTVDPNISADLVYALNNNHIFTNFKTGTIEISYKAFPCDKNGYPMIPDDVKYELAVKTYIMKKIAHKCWIKNIIDISKKNHFDQESAWYMGAAQSRGNMPSTDQMESFKNSWLRAIPKINQHAQGFKNLGDREVNYTHS